MKIYNAMAIEQLTQTKALKTKMQKYKNANERLLVADNSDSQFLRSIISMPAYRIIGDGVGYAFLKFTPQFHVQLYVCMYVCIMLTCKNVDTYQQSKLYTVHYLVSEET